MPESEPVPDPVGQLEFEAARDAVLAVLAFYTEQIDAEERRPAPDADVIARLAKNRIVYGAVLQELQSADAAGVAEITVRAYTDLARLEAGGAPR
ncbi:hypothetical protein SAM9427_36465 (plasmid) [Streptomyces sp. ETH9427]|uniref:hypothetical protein n=1 Tax=Streptomyces sp. E1N211 TaxID=1851876 RepID=UPI000E0AC384|nr:hypothetical protein [Streptomyces sp. E1N211]AXI91263.1 hypothetical protein SAM9427_36465 [Streptomyces sp. ETH9427]